MPPRGYKKSNGSTIEPIKRREIKKVPIEAPIMLISKNPGDLGAQGIRVRPKVWTNCSDEDCGRPIYFVKVGSRCTRHAIEAANV